MNRILPGPATNFPAPCLLLYFLLLLAGCTPAGKQNQPGQKPELSEIIEMDIAGAVAPSVVLIMDEGNLPNTKYTSDKDHSSISFRTKHWEIVDLIGWFDDFQIVMYADSADFSDAVIYGEVNPRSIQMPNSKMAGTVQQLPYIDTEKYPKVSFRSDQLHPTGGNNYLLSGTMTMNGIEKTIRWKVTFNGYAYPGERSICGFDVEGRIDRNDFQVGGDDRLHSGRQVHDDSIFLYLSLRME